MAQSPDSTPEAPLYIHISCLPSYHPTTTTITTTTTTPKRRICALCHTDIIGPYATFAETSNPDETVPESSVDKMRYSFYHPECIAKKMTCESCGAALGESFSVCGGLKMCPICIEKVGPVEEVEVVVRSRLDGLRVNNITGTISNSILSTSVLLLLFISDLCIL